MGGITFTQFPASWRLPLWWAEIDPSQAGTGIQVEIALLVGQMLPAGIAELDVPVPCGSLETAQNLVGIGSMLERMFNAFYNNNSAQEIWLLPVDNPIGGVAATGTITVSSPPTQAGTLDLWIAGQDVQVGIGSTDSEATIAANIVEAINEMTTLPVTAALSHSGGNAVVLTCKWIGLTGNDIDMRDSYLGSLGGEQLPQGMALTYSNSGKLSGGTGTVTFTTAIANMGDQPFEYVALPYTDSGSLLAWETEFGFTTGGRWGWMRQLYGQIYTARRDTYENLLTWGSTNNYPFSAMAVEVDSPTPIWEWTAAYDAEAAMGFSNDPALPLQTLELIGCMPARKQNRFSLPELNLLASTGLATQKTDPNGVPMILRETSAYQVNQYGNPDIAYTDMTTLATLSALLRNQRDAITNKFPRYKLADDGTTFAPGQKIVTPNIIKAELISEYSLDEYNGLVEDASVFATNLIVQRDTTNPDRVNVLYPPNLIGQLRIFAVLAQFRLLGSEQTTQPQS